MKHYEIVLLIHPDQSEQVPGMVERYRSTVEESGGKVHRYEDWGRRQLAYPINKIPHKAHYVCINIECSVEVLNDLKSAFKFNDAVLRNMIVVMKKAETEPSFIMQSKDSENERTNRRDNDRRDNDRRDSDRGERSTSDRRDNDRLEAEA